MAWRRRKEPPRLMQNLIGFWVKQNGVGPKMKEKSYWRGLGQLGG